MSLAITLLGLLALLCTRVPLCFLLCNNMCLPSMRMCASRPCESLKLHCHATLSAVLRVFQFVAVLTQSHQKQCVVVQNGSLTNENKQLPAWMQQNITTASSGQLYVATPGVDMPFGYPLKANNGSCSLITNKYSAVIDSCAHNVDCCVDTTEWEVQKAATRHVCAATADCICLKDYTICK